VDLSYRGHFILPLASILSQLIPVRNFPSFLFKAGSRNFPKYPAATSKFYGPERCYHATSMLRNRKNRY